MDPDRVSQLIQNVKYLRLGILMPPVANVRLITPTEALLEIRSAAFPFLSRQPQERRPPLLSRIPSLSRLAPCR